LYGQAELSGTAPMAAYMAHTLRMRNESLPLGEQLMWPSATKGAVETKKTFCWAIHAWSEGAMVA
jgi:hypothetical protein